MRIDRRLLTIGIVAAAPLYGQQREVGLLYGNWSAGPVVSYEARLDRPLWPWLRHGATLHVLTERGLGGRDFFGVGYELQAFRGVKTIGPYAVLNGALGVLNDSTQQRLGALWSAGLGLEWRPVQLIALDVEQRYRVTDRGPRGFWHPGIPHKGWGTSLGVSISLGRVPSRAPMSEAGSGPASSTAPATPPLMIVGHAADVVRTALDVLGSPYQWGGTAENGFDCSGLIQYAYGRFGIRLPRTSRGQALVGSPVPPVLDSLHPGDILTFAARAGGGVTHVGMFVGEGKFIHSSTTGVRLSRLERSDPEGAYWIPRWVGVRRVLP
jgi:cell wall-associated NlpC family hydrolase